MGHTGKENDRFMESVVYAHLGRPSRRLTVGPGRGLDNGVFSVGDGKVIIFTLDPISVLPAFGMRLSAWLSVHLIASDYTASGADPEFALFSYNFPDAMSRGEREEYVTAISEECRALGVSIAGGHTGSYPGGGFTVIGTGAMLGFAAEGEYVAPSMARTGDSVIMTKQAAIEATASLSLSFPRFTDAHVGAALGRKARDMVWLCSSVADAHAARRVGIGPGAVTSMHDATEGGVLGALDEMAAASLKAFCIDPASIPVARESSAVCASFGIDPLTTMGEGALLITCHPSKVPELIGALRRSRINAKEIGKVTTGSGLWLRKGKGSRRRFVPHGDAYWPAYDRAVRLRLK